MIKKAKEAIKPEYRPAVDSAIKELTELTARREELEEELEKVVFRIEVVESGINGLEDLSGIDIKKAYPHLFQDAIKSDVGFTDAVRKVMKSAGPRQLFTPLLVRDSLAEKGFDLARYQNPLASIHTILKRLRDNGEVIAIPDSSTGKIFFEWDFSKVGKRI